MDYDLSRRDVLWMSAIAAVALTPMGRALAADGAVIDAGEVAKYSEPGIYPEFQPRGFFVIHREGRLVAQGSLCTHKRCKIKPSSEGFACSCHGSRFSVEGKVLRPPAKKNLPRFGVSLNDAGHVIVDMSREYEANDFEESGAYLKMPSQQ